MSIRYRIEKLENAEWIIWDNEKNECVAKCSTRAKVLNRLKWIIENRGE